MRAVVLSLLTVVASGHEGPPRAPEEGAVVVAQLSERIPRLFVDAVNNVIRGQIRPERIRYSPPGTLTLENTALLDPHGHVVTRVESARVDIAITPLLTGNLVIKRLDLVRPALDLELEDGRLNLVEALSAKKKSNVDEGPPDVEIRLDDVSVTGARFSYADVARNIKVATRGIAGRGRVDVDLARRSFVLVARDVTAEAGRVELEAVALPLAAVRVERVRVVNDRVEVVNGRGRALEVGVTAAGSLSWEGKGRLAFSGHADGPPRQWPDKLAPPPFDMPAFAADFDVTGTFEEPAVSVLGTFRETTAFEYPVSGGEGEVVVRRDRADILRASVRSGNARATARGTVRFDPRTLDVDGTVDKVSLALALAPAKLDDVPKGTLAGSYRLRGSYRLEGEPLAVTSSLSARGVEWSGVVPPSPLDVEARLGVTRARVALESVDVRGRGTDVKLSGDVEVEQRRVALTVRAAADTPTAWVPDVPARVRLERASFDGQVTGPFDDVRVSGAVEAPAGDVYGVPLLALRARLVVDRRLVRIDDVRGTAAEGALKGRVALRLSEARGKRRADPRLEGELTLERAALATVTLVDDGSFALGGTASARATLGGTTRSPVIEAAAEVDDGVVAGEAVGRVTSRFLVTRERVRVAELVADGPIGRLVNDGPVVVRFQDLALSGDLVVEARDLAQLAAAKEAALGGAARGRVRLGGTVDDPDVLAWLEVDDLVARGSPLGDGPVFARFVSEPLATTAERRRAVQATGRLSGPRGLFKVRASYAIERKVVNAELRLVDVDLRPWLETLPTDVPRADGVVTGFLHVFGRVDALEGEARLVVPELVFDDAAAPVEEPAANAAGAALPSAARELRRVRASGGLLIDARLDDGKLEALLCAFPEKVDVTVGPCTGGARVWVRADGTVDQRAEAFDIALRVYADEQHVERFVPALRDVGAKLGVVVTSNARLVRRAGAEALEVSGEATLMAAHLEVEGAPPGDLLEPARLRFDKTAVRLQEPLRLAVGESELSVSGFAGARDVDLAIDGTVVLALLKLATPEITQASGTAETSLQLARTAGAPLEIAGTIRPNKGAAVTLRSLRQRLEVAHGQIAFRPAEAPGAASAVRVVVDDVILLVGEGQAGLDGGVTVLLEESEGGGTRVGRLVDWDLSARGEGIRVRRERSRVEAAFNLSLEQRGETPVLLGQLEVTDGLYRERFELLDNFVLTRPERPSEPLYKTLEPYGLADLRLDVDVAVSDFRVRADIVNFPMDAAVVGNLNLGSSVRVPALSGALEIVEGSLVFPRARFELADSQIEFPQERGSLEPRVSVSARSDLPPGRTGCETDLPVMLTFKGETPDELVMDLTAEGAEQHTRFDLFMNVLFGQRLAQCEAARGIGDPTNAAVRAFSGELTSGVTRQFEELIAEQLGGELQLNVFAESGRIGTDVRFQLGRRVVFEGEAPLYTWDAVQGTERSAEQGLNTSNLRLQFLWFDHLPPNDGELFLEGELSTREDTGVGADPALLEGRLKYRVLEY